MWVISNLYEELKEQDEYADIHECFNGHPLEEYLDDLIELTITTINYLKLIELCDYLMVTNADILIDEIVKNFGIPVIHEFGEFYRYVACSGFSRNDKCGSMRRYPETS